VTFAVKFKQINTLTMNFAKSATLGTYLKGKTEMDEHLNVFYPYSIKENDNIREDNITRASLIAFGEIDNKGKFLFINSLLNKDILDADSDYEYKIELQPTSIITEDCIKYLIGFCPNGKVRGCSNKEDSIEKIYYATSDHSARADGEICIYRNGSLYAVLVFENKLQDLFEDQLKRHFEFLLGMTKKEDIINSLVLLSYADFFDLYKKFDYRLCDDLIEFVNIAGYLKPSQFSDLEKNKYNRKRNIEYLLGKTLDSICINGKRRVQTGWGEIIDIKSINEIIDMIGLVYHPDKDTIQLSLLFGSRMKSAQKLYRLIQSKKICLTNDFVGEFHAGYVMGYIENSYIGVNDAQRYIRFVIDNIEDLKQCDLSDLKTYVNNMVKATGTSFDETQYCFSDKRLTHGHINLIPSLGYSVYWSVSDLYKMTLDEFVTLCKSKIGECISSIGIKISY